jgi:cyclophilin family peptidyl-prolyl cis-trans isomerase
MNRLLALLLVSVCASCSVVRPLAPSANQGNGPLVEPALADGLYAEISTPRGVMLCELYFQKLPLTVSSFVGLAEGKLGPEPRKPFYDGLKFHRVVPGFVVQGGDPTGTGRGSPGYRFPDEFVSGLKHDGPGILSMANSGPDTNGSQFFVTLGEARYLDFVHSIFGRVVRGLDVVSQIQRDDSMTVKILRRGRAARRFQVDEKSFAQLLARAPRAAPPHFVDRSGLGAAGEHWQAKYLENRLSNLARFTGRQVFVRLLAAFEPDTPGQTTQAYVDDMPAKLNLPPGALLACYFAHEDEWRLAARPPGVTLPEIKPTAPGPPPATPESAARQRQNQLYTATGQVVSSLIDQTDPK